MSGRRVILLMSVLQNDGENSSDRRDVKKGPLEALKDDSD